MTALSPQKQQPKCASGLTFTGTDASGAAICGDFPDIQNFVGMSFNASGTIGVRSLAASFNKSGSLTGGSASVSTPGKAFSFTASRTYIYGCTYAK